MATDTTILQGEVSENPQELKLDVERVLAALLRSLINEQTEQRDQNVQVKA